MSITMHTHRYDTSRSCYASHQIAYNTNVYTNANKKNTQNIISITIPTPFLIKKNINRMSIQVESLQSSGVLKLPK